MRVILRVLTAGFLTLLLIRIAISFSVNFANLKVLCEEHLKGRYQIEVIDLMENPQLARGDQIVAVPTLVRKLPQPVRKIIGDLSNSVRALVGLDLQKVD